MLNALDPATVRAAFSQPNNDGSFPPAFRSYLRALGSGRPSVILAFAPKAAGTFLRTAAILATDGQLVRIVHAQGGRDAQPYLPMFLSYFSGVLGPAPMVTHVHLQALPANCHFIEALDLRPIIMLRSIPDMLASYWDMLETDADARDNALNCQVPKDFPVWSREAKGDFVIDVLAPWYASYFATWLDFAARDPQRVCVLQYRAFVQDPAASLQRILVHSGIPTSSDICRHAIEEVWDERGDFRFNRGESGRGADYFTPDQFARLARMSSYYPILRTRSADLA